MVESKTCSERKFAEVDARLSRAFEKIVADIAKPGANPRPIHLDKEIEHTLTTEEQTAQRKLVLSEKAWKQYREAACSAIETLVGAGTSHDLDKYRCLITLTLKHLEELESTVDPILQGGGPDEKEHTNWISTVLEESAALKPGMTRRDLMRMRTYGEEGGISWRNHRTYVYKDCPFIKVDVDFEPAGEPNELGESADDKIVKVSQPYLQWSVLD